MVAADGSRIIERAFDAYQSAFRTITLRACQRFESRDWAGAQADAAARLELYKDTVTGAVRALRETLGRDLEDRETWRQMKATCSVAFSGREDREIAETFFNSVTRRVFATIGVDPAIEFVASDLERSSPEGSDLPEAFPASDSLEDLVARILRRFAFTAPYASPAHDARAAGRRIARALHGRHLGPLVEASLLPTHFFRGKGAYLVGRLICERGVAPIAFAFLNEPEGVVLDAVLLDEDAVSIVFGFTRSYFHVDAPRPWALVRFLKSIMPMKRVAELYIAVGYNKHGKTELYRDLLGHLASSEDRFVLARGERGMVMVVFTLPSYDLVFKVIRDRFPPSKHVTREGVRAKYDLVFRHDRAGRLIDAQEFEHVAFDAARFSPEALDELVREASMNAVVRNGRIELRHLYVERRLTPLNLFVREASFGEATAAVEDYGQAIRDLVAANIFPGDILLKNFGLTRHRRVVFYDYDELARVTDCRFRSLPQSNDPALEMEADPWFFVGENDVFPEEFARFLGMPETLRSHFVAVHGELFDPAFWKTMQARIAGGEIVDVFPYTSVERLPRPPGAT